VLFFVEIFSTTLLTALDMALTTLFTAGLAACFKGFAAVFTFAFTLAFEAGFFSVALLALTDFFTAIHLFIYLAARLGQVK
jgi:hypothetical protein